MKTRRRIASLVVHCSTEKVADFKTPPEESAHVMISVTEPFWRSRSRRSRAVSTETQCSTTTAFWWSCHRPLRYPPTRFPKPQEHDTRKNRFEKQEFAPYWRLRCCLCWLLAKRLFRNRECGPSCDSTVPPNRLSLPPGRNGFRGAVSRLTRCAVESSKCRPDDVPRQRYVSSGGVPEPSYLRRSQISAGRTKNSNSPASLVCSLPPRPAWVAASRGGATKLSSGNDRDHPGRAVADVQGYVSLWSVFD